SAVKADVTVSFIGVKRGLLTHQGPEYCGQLMFSDLEVGSPVYDQVPSSLALIDQAYVAHYLPARNRGAHKGSFGHLLIIGGNQGMAGAVLMAAEAAARSGAGLVSVATRPEHVGSCHARCPEVMAHGVSRAEQIEPLLARATTVLIGPGLGAGAWAEQMLAAVSASNLPSVWDADALNLLSRSANLQSLMNQSRIITPHPGEASRLLGCSIADIQADRFAAVKSLQQRYGGVSILKGAGSLVCDGIDTRLCKQGNPGMASGGMGDVLAGIIASLLAQQLPPMAAAAVAVRVHAEAADRAAAATGERGLLATDLIGYLGVLLNPRQLISL
ncbi:MAG: NAD(P)H-hydrate dehydratase, partial [Motiliproteus sp.]